LRNTPAIGVRLRVISEHPGNTVKVNRLPYRIKPDPSRVITRLFAWPEEHRNARRIERILALPDDRAAQMAADLREEYREHIADIVETWHENYRAVQHLVPRQALPLPEHLQMLIGAFFTSEYAIESAALFNPSIVRAQDQTGAPPGTTRFLMSFRATGEGHLSSVVFRSGAIDRENNITFEKQPRNRSPLQAVEDAAFNTRQFRRVLVDIGAHDPFQQMVLKELGEEFTLAELNAALDEAMNIHPLPVAWEESAATMLTLARSDYRLEIPPGMDPAEIVIFPRSENERRGIEDLRLVQFTDEDGSQVLYGTYTAFNGTAVFPTLMELRDERTIEVHTMRGQYALNKGMALFPRRINGRYVMSGRLDGESLYILESDNVLVWNEGRIAQEPEYAWELSVMGNCGSPIETEEGWLLLTHGVGPMRQYCISAMLLDLEDPARMIGRLSEPLIVPTGDERIGYVPNVVYTCGAMLHNEWLLIPYAVSDSLTAFATVDFRELLEALKAGGRTLAGSSAHHMERGREK